MADHPMSEGQRFKVWRIPDGKPCRVEDLRVGDLHMIEGQIGIFVVTHLPRRGMDGEWEGSGITVDEFEAYRAGKINMTVGGVDFDLNKAIEEGR